jgi:hypothetical protein
MATTDMDILVGLLTDEEKDQLVGQQYAPDSYFNPIQDDNDNWIISVEEMNASDLTWIKDLPLIVYVPKKLIEIIQPPQPPVEPTTEDQVAEIVTEETTSEENPTTEGNPV